MKHFRPLLFLAAGVMVALPAAAVPITVLYQGSIIEGSPGVDQGLPILLCQCLNNVRFKFFVPDYASLVGVNSINVSVDVYNEFANSFEQGSLLFVLNGIGQPNVLLNTFSNLTGTSDLFPLQVPGTVGAGDLLNALLEIQGDGIFFVRVNRDGNNKQGNNFFVTNPTVAIDGEMVPEPSTLWLLGVGLTLALFCGARSQRAVSTLVSRPVERK